jgi:hypothetical protein
MMPSTVAAGRVRRARHRAHQAHAAAAVDQLDAGVGQRLAHAAGGARNSGSASSDDPQNTQADSRRWR